MSDAELSLATRAAWLAYVGGYTQEQIAERLGVSRVKAHRLIAAARESGCLKVFVEGVPAECIALEDQLTKCFGLSFCSVVPTLTGKGETAADTFHTLGVAGAQFLYRLLEKSGPTVIGLGHGRTLSAVVDQLPHIPHPDLRFVSLLGGLTRKASANPFDVMYRITERTGGEGYIMPVPLYADSVDDAEVLLSQRSMQHVLSLARQCEVCLVGIGDLGPNSVFNQLGMITAAEHRELLALGAVGDLLGQFVNAEGRIVDCDMNRRVLGIHLAELRGREVVAIAGGMEKSEAIAAILKSGIITGLITDEVAAQQVLIRVDGREREVASQRTAQRIS